ncbi:MAG: radical SAM protein, partial [Lachnospiraceae bacterium]|nr:radical SAM protein [Lachnospiraceae bacterium]
ANYGIISGLALDPIEKKPLYRFHPGSRILSVGSYGCNLRCPFCQNSDISWSDEALLHAHGDSAKAHAPWRMRREELVQTTPQELCDAAQYYISRGNIGIAFTYNEPLVGWEFVRDTAKLVHEAGMKNVLVTNGTAQPAVLEELAPYIDAMNIDLKGLSEAYYHSTLGGDLSMVKEFISRAVQFCHVELTTLIVPGENDTDGEMRAITEWIASLTDAQGKEIGRTVPLHISRFFPRFHMIGRPATDVRCIYRLAEVARETLKYVYTGNC